MAKLRRKILWCVAVLGLCLVSLLGLAAFVYRDERPPADGDLTSYRRPVRGRGTAMGPHPSPVRPPF